MKIATTDTEFLDMRFATDKRGEFVRVSRRALAHLLHDHVELLRAATGPVHRGGKGHAVDIAEDQASLS